IVQITRALLGNAAAVRTSRGIDALRVDAGDPFNLLDHGLREGDVVDLVLLRVLAAEANVPRVVAVVAVGIGHDETDAVGLGLPSIRVFLPRAGAAQEMEVDDHAEALGAG